MRTSYYDLCALFESKGCKLLTNQAEYDGKNLVKQDKYRYIAKCGHENEVRGTNFMNNSGINCKACAKVSGNQKSIATQKLETTNIISRTRDVITKFTNLIDGDNQLEWKLTADKYSFSDVYIHRVCDSVDNWLRIHIVYLTGEKFQFITRTRSNYRYLTVCLTNAEDAWIIPDTVCNGLKYINISKREKTKYARFKIQTDQLKRVLYEYANIVSTPDLQLVTKRHHDHSLEYEEILEYITKKQCKLLTSKHEFTTNKMNTKSQLHMQMNCSHNMNVSFNVFKKRAHYSCVSCITKIVQSQAYNDSNRVTSGAMLEACAFKFIKDTVCDQFEVIKSHEGCRVDMIIKPKSVNDNKWIGIQLKSRTKQKAQYTFNKVGSYPNIIVLCVVIPEFKMWLFEGNALLGQKGLSIGMSKSKYAANEMNVLSIKEKLFEMYDKLEKNTLEYMMIPITALSQKEHSNRLRRESLLPNCVFQYPPIDGTKYDVIINGFKIQDKCATTKTKKSTKFFSIRLSSEYCKGDNDFYWINLPDQSFYIIPEFVLLNSDDSIRNDLYLSKAYNQYKYDPNNDPHCRDKIEKLLTYS